MNHPIQNQKVSTRAKNLIFALCKWLVMGMVTGTIVGLVGTAFAFSLDFVNGFRAQHPAIVFGLPFAGLAIVGLYRAAKDTDNTGTNMVIDFIHSANGISRKMAPLIFISTVLTHLCGGSAGREGAALQLGGGITNFLSELKFLHFTENDHKVNIMCGMSAGFAALFGTPLAAAIFSLEVVSIGIMHYSALVPSVISAYTAYFISTGFGVHPEAFLVAVIPTFTPVRMLQFIFFGGVLGSISVLTCFCLHTAEHRLAHWFKNPYLRIATAGSMIVLLSLLPGMKQYLGSGIGIIEHIFETESPAPCASFLLKMLFTALTIGAGFKGGEIVPSFTIGAAFGSLWAVLLGVPVPLAAACGMLGVFCGVTNCPLTSLLIGFEMFGFEGMPYYLFTVAASFMLSGYYSLYTTQKIVYSKTGMHEN